VAVAVAVLATVLGVLLGQVLLVARQVLLAARDH
jgi:hypothetical protein